MMVTHVVASVHRKPPGRKPRVPNERVFILRVRLAESEMERLRQAAAANHQYMTEFVRLAVTDAAEESGEGPIVLMLDRRQAERRRRPGDDQPVELERRAAARRRPR